MGTTSSTRGRGPRRVRNGWRYTRHIDRWVKAGLVLATEYEGRPLYRTPLPPKGATFDAVAVERVLKFFCLLRHVVGRWSGVDFRLLDWQVEFLVAPVFGVKNSDGWRTVRTFWFEIPRKNGKSAVAAGLGLYLVSADREPGAEVYAAAGKKDQATKVFRPAKLMAKGAPQLAAKLKILGNLIEHRATNSTFQPVASDGELEHGSNVHGAIIDEVHVHKNRDIIDALETGTGARTQPIVGFITTADAGDVSSIYAEKRAYCELVAKGTVDDPSFYGVVFGLDRDDPAFDPFSDESIALANPGAGITVQWDYLRRKALEAQTSPGALNRYLRLHLNVRTGSRSAWFSPAAWDAGAGLVVEAELAGRACYGGLDIASTQDFSALAWLFEGDTSDDWTALYRFWLPRAAVERRKDLRPMLEQWEADGLIRVTDGDVQDQAAIRAQIEDDARLFRVVELAYDPWNSGFMPELVEAGLPGWELRQTVTSLNEASKTFERMVGERRFHHGGNPVLRWMAGNVTLFTDSAGNIKPDKSKSHEKIDGIAATINAVAAAIRDRPVVHRPSTATAVGGGITSTGRLTL